MTTAPSPLPAPLTQQDRDDIADLFLEGRRVSEVIAHGLNRQPGWRRQQVIDLLAARGWQLDSDGRIPRRFRTSVAIPATPLPGGLIPEPPRRPVVEFPDRATVTEGPRALGTSVSQMIADGRAHATARVRRLADKADVALKDLRSALAKEQERDGVRRRLAELEAEAAKLRATLGGPGRPKKVTTPSSAGTSSTTTEINHGTWGGFLTEKRRGLEHCADCTAAKDATMAERAAKRSQA